MLTKDLLRYHRVGQQLKPQFIDEENDILLDFAHQVINLYQQDEKRQVLEEKANYLTNGFSDVKLAKGLSKLCMDRSSFSPSQDRAEYRQQIFSKSFKLLDEGNFSSYQQFRKMIHQDYDNEIQLYSDLPINDTLTKFKSLSATQLLQRYNVSLIQSLLFHSTEILIEIQKTPIAELRVFFKYLRFFRLLFEVKKVKTKYLIEISGAQSLFEQTQKYGLQLASFFPAIISLPHWKMTANLKMGQKLQLKASHKQNLKSHYNHFGDYIPEEISIFEKEFSIKKSIWKIEKQIQLKQDKQVIFIPDFSFKHKESKKIIHLELFHRWHKFQLLERLKNLNDDYIIGIERSLLKDKQIKALIEKEDNQMFLYRDFPGVNVVLKALNNKEKVN